MISEAKEAFYAGLKQSEERGWEFRSGDPESWNQKKLLVKGGKLLDLGIGPIARASLTFALRGMEVTGIDSSPECVNHLRKMASENDLPIQVIEDDIRTCELGHEVYDTVLLSQTFVHFEGKIAAYEVIDRAMAALKPGGHLWIRAAGKLDDSYQQLHEALFNPYLYGPVEKVNDDVFRILCDCSGEEKIEDMLFFDPLDLPSILAQKGMKLVHTQVIPNEGTANIMFGEDWQRCQGNYSTHGVVTVIARKEK